MAIFSIVVKNGTSEDLWLKDAFDNGTPVFLGTGPLDITAFVSNISCGHGETKYFLETKKEG